MKSTFRLVIFCIGMLALPAQLMAQTIAYVDARRLIDESPQGRVEMQKLEEEFGVRRQDLQRRMDEYIAKEEDLKKNSLLMTSEEVDEKLQELTDLQRFLRREQELYNDDYSRSRNQGIVRLEEMISQVIFKVAREQEIDLVLQQVVYASSSIDFTDMILKELERMFREEGGS
ncbi:MAG: OmpH family outer membrane protein [Gammaproteobacteria bacterium]|nr:OmpH family outer membrane protein [Gammaproteobacteria bacterium]MYD76247.1 OmpH family outer membrane protein [Gammaproteobacteria bacterium]MYJ52594.1 OmpH family outer membrane protein [Gammaproteobacteria bacterium]